MTPFEWSELTIAGFLTCFSLVGIWMYVTSREAGEWRKVERQRAYEQMLEKMKAARERQEDELEVPAFMREAANLHNLAEPDALEVKLALMMAGNASVGELDDVYNNVQPKPRRGRPRKLVVH